jgi:hypothetical protein
MHQPRLLTGKDGTDLGLKQTQLAILD